MAEENISELEDRYEKITNNAAGSEKEMGTMRG